MASGKRTGNKSPVQGQALRQFRSDVAKLKRLGIVSKRVDARSQKPTRYMRSRVKAMQDVLAGEAKVIRAPRDTVDQYRAARTLRTAGRDRLVVPLDDPMQKVRIDERGYVERVRALKNGEIADVIIPLKPTDLRTFVERMIKDRDAIDALKRRDEYFTFRIGENNARESFANTDEMAEYLLKYYDRASSPITSRKTFVEAEFTFQRFKTKDGEYMRNPHQSTRPKKPYPASDQSGRNNGRDSNARDRARNAAKVRRQRAKETPKQREARLSRNRIRAAQWRQRQFEGE